MPKRAPVHMSLRTGRGLHKILLIVIPTTTNYEQAHFFSMENNAGAFSLFGMAQIYALAGSAFLSGTAQVHLPSKANSNANQAHIKAPSSGRATSAFPPCLSGKRDQKS
jgi:hypothetical protein